MFISAANACAGSRHNAPIPGLETQPILYMLVSKKLFRHVGLVTNGVSLPMPLRAGGGV